MEKSSRIQWISIYAVNITLFLGMLLYASIVFAHASGMTGVTQKNGNGCTCHGAAPTTSVLVSISGPADLLVNQTGNYTVTIQGGPAVRAGTDIAVSGGTLEASSSTLQKIGDELTHVSPQPFTSGTATFSFAYTAPSTPGTQTIYANGNSVNFNSSNSGDQWNFAPNKTVNVRASTTAADAGTAIPHQFSLSQNYPNPFNPSTVISYVLPIASQTTLTISDVRGRDIATLLDEEKPAGLHTVKWDAAGLPSGVYFLRMKAGEFVQTRKLLLTK
jgi:uncharacterized Zn-binding protein involved in type VI secretion